MVKAALRLDRSDLAYRFAPVERVMGMAGGRSSGQSQSVDDVVADVIRAVSEARDTEQRIRDLLKKIPN